MDTKQDNEQFVDELKGDVLSRVQRFTDETGIYVTHIRLDVVITDRMAERSSAVYGQVELGVLVI